jgi:hypothetical protein
MDGPTGVGREPQVSDHDLLFCDKLWAPLCAQCRSRMTIALCEPDFKNSSVATYRCPECGLWIARVFTSG